MFKSILVALTRNRNGEKHFWNGLYVKQHTSIRTLLIECRLDYWEVKTRRASELDRPQRLIYDFELLSLRWVLTRSIVIAKRISRFELEYGDNGLRFVFGFVIIIDHDHNEAELDNWLEEKSIITRVDVWILVFNCHTWLLI